VTHLPVTYLRRTLVLAAAALVVGVVACEDPFAPTADTANFDATIESWALTGSPANYPTVLLVPLGITARPDAAASFDVGFDIDVDGRLVVLPVSKVVSSTLGDRRVGIIRSSEIYNTITEAPRTGWIYDSTLAVNEGQIIILRVMTQFCDGQLQNEVYAKFHVDSIFPAERRVKLSGRINPNCGFRSFLSGIPKF
jgi:hypothetical protein